MINIRPGKKEAKDIKQQANRILRDLGDPEPPFVIEDALHLLKLDRKYYSSVEDGFIQEVVHKIIVSGKQILGRPSLLVDVIRKAELQALWIPDSKQILIDKNSPPLRHRWSEIHEIAHATIPWHRQFCLGDPAQTLKANCQIKIENEANYGGGQLLFLGERFRKESLSYEPSIETVKHLAEIYGNTITSTLYRFVEEAHESVPMFALVCDHWFDPDCDFNHQSPCDHFIVSESFREQFSDFNQIRAFSYLQDYCMKRKGGHLGKAEVTIIDDNFNAHYFHLESFSNTYKVLTLAVYHRPITTNVMVGV